MIDNDFSGIQLRFKEHWKLRYMRWLHKRVPADFFPDSLTDLKVVGFIREIPANKRDPFNAPIGSGEYKITDRYIRYCIYRRDRFLHGSVWPAILSGIVSLLVSCLVAGFVTQHTIEQEVARQLTEVLTKLQ